MATYEKKTQPDSERGQSHWDKLQAYGVDAWVRDLSTGRRYSLRDLVPLYRGENLKPIEAGVRSTAGPWMETDGTITHGKVAYGETVCINFLRAV